jgi:hypothetical protein
VPALCHGKGTNGSDCFLVQNIWGQREGTKASRVVVTLQWRLVYEGAYVCQESEVKRCRGAPAVNAHGFFGSSECSAVTNGAAQQAEVGKGPERGKWHVRSGTTEIHINICRRICSVHGSWSKFLYPGTAILRE